MSEATLVAEKRTDLGKQSAKALRKNGSIPAVYYTHGEEAVPVTVDEKALNALLQTETNVIDLSIGNEKQKNKCVMREIQWEPVNGSVLHVDFMGINVDEKVTVSVPIHILGEAVGVKQGGGNLQQLLREVLVEALPLDMPEHVDIDVANLNIGEGVLVEDVKLEKAQIVTEGSQSIVLVRAPKVGGDDAVVDEEESVETDNEEV